MKDILNFLSALFFISLSVVVVFSQILSTKFFNQLKSDYPTFLKSKIKKYSWLNAYTQLAILVFFGKYKDVEDSVFLKKLNNQRLFLTICYLLALSCILAILVEILVTRQY